MLLEQAHSETPTPVDAAAAPIDSLLDAGEFDRLQRLSTLIGIPLMACDPRQGTILTETGIELRPAVPLALVRQSARVRQPQTLVSDSGLAYFAIPLSAATEGAPIALGHVLTGRGQRPADLVLAAAQRNWSSAQFDEWVSRQRVCDPELLQQLVRLAFSESERADRRQATDDDSARVAQQLEYTYEELSLLHTLTQNMHISRSPREIAELSLKRIGSVIQAGGHAIWLDDKRDGRMFLIEGTIPVDELGMARLIARFDGHDWPRPLVRNNVAATLLGADFPRLRNFSLVSIADGRLRFGWVLSCNLAEGDFGSVQTSLLSSVASILGTHQHNLELYHRHENLLLSFVRSLVSTLDAKDAYTRGHSERVALVARRLGAHLGLPEADLRDIYLSGLLHDIGKIGVDDQILRKPGQLTPAEFEQIKRHPVIGYGILAGLKNLHGVLPGVRHHHEAFSGRGYPDGLKGDEIPLMARIIAVADSFDAMISDRPYRPGLGIDELEKILRNGAGIQWDPRVVAAYFSVRDEVRSMWDTYAPGGDPLGSATAELDELALNRDPLRAVEGIRDALERVSCT